MFKKYHPYEPNGVVYVNLLYVDINFNTGMYIVLLFMYLFINL